MRDLSIPEDLTADQMVDQKVIAEIDHNLVVAIVIVITLDKEISNPRNNLLKP